MTESILSWEQGRDPQNSGGGALHGLAVSYRPRPVLPSCRPAAKNVDAVSFTPLRVEVLGRAILV